MPFWKSLYRNRQRLTTLIQVRLSLTSHQVQHVAFLITPMQPQYFYPPRESRIALDPLEDIQSPVWGLGVLAEVKVDGMEYEWERDAAVKSRDRQPSAKVITGDVTCYSVPDFGWGALWRGRAFEVNLINGIDAMWLLEESERTHASIFFADLGMDLTASGVQP